MTDSTGREELSRRWNDCARIASRIAHDFDNVLTGVNGFAELALANLPPEHAAHQFVREILHASEKGSEFSSQLHKLQRSGVFRPQPSAVGPVMTRLERSVRALLPPGVGLSLQTAADVPHVFMDPEPLFLALNEMLMNAVEACGESGTINLAAGPARLDAEGVAKLFGIARPGAFAEIRIADSGPGIPPEVHERLLIEPMFTTKFRHRGIGLAIAYRALSAHGGGFRLDPASPVGTVASVFVPVA